MRTPIYITALFIPPIIAVGLEDYYLAILSYHLIGFLMAVDFAQIFEYVLSTRPTTNVSRAALFIILAVVCLGIMFLWPISVLYFLLIPRRP